MKHATKILALLLALVMGLSLVACGGGDSSTPTADGGAGTGNGGGSTGGSTSGQKLVIWALADDLKDIGAYYQEQTGVEVEVNVIAPADYHTKLQTAIMGHDDTVDIIMGEPQMMSTVSSWPMMAVCSFVG